MPILTDEIKTFIVRSLACFDTPSDVVEAVKAKFDVEVTRQHVHLYDPDCAQRPASRWCELHAATRRAFLRDRAEIGVAQRNVRLRMLDRLAHRAEERNYMGLTAAFLEQAARECGGMYDRQRFHRPAEYPADPSDAEPLPTPSATATSGAASPAGRRGAELHQLRPGLDEIENRPGTATRALLPASSEA
jgi:hypothetical protein